MASAESRKAIMPRLFVVLAVFASLATTAEAFKPVPRRDALRIGAAALIAPSFAQPASAKSKRRDLDEAEAKVKAEIAAQTGLAAGASGKGLRGYNPDFDAKDTVQRNRKQNGGLARDETGRKVVTSDRNPNFADLGLKQWDGAI